MTVMAAAAKQILHTERPRVRVRITRPIVLKARVLYRRLDGATENETGALFGARRARPWWPERFAFGEDQAPHGRRDDHAERRIGARLQVASARPHAMRIASSVFVRSVEHVSASDNSAATDRQICTRAVTHAA
jgi:hypothetical protein